MRAFKDALRIISAVFVLIVLGVMGLIGLLIINPVFWLAVIALILVMNI